MSDEMQDWLSGKTAKKDHYAEEKAEIRAAIEQGIPDDIREKADAYRSALDSPYNRSYTPRYASDLDLVYECLRQMLFTNEPLPKMLTLELMMEIELLKSNREGNVFRRGKNPTTHPVELTWHSYVIVYVDQAKKRGFDDNPIKTIKEELGIGKSTYYDWKKEVSGRHELSVLLDWISVLDDEHAKKELQRLWRDLLEHFSPE